MAHKKGVGSTDNGRDSKSKRLGVKMFGGQVAKAGNILVRQRGTEYHPGNNVYMGKDHTLHALIDGVVVFKRTKNDRRFVSIMPMEIVAETVAKVDVKPAAPAAEPKTRKAAAPAAKPAVEIPAVDLAAEPAVETPVLDLAAEPAVETPVLDLAAEPAVETPAPDLAAEAPAAEEDKAASKAASKKAPKLNDLKIIEGVGPKIEQLLKDGGIETWEALAETPVDRLREILDAAGSRYQIHDPSTWPAQARFAAEGKWDELKEYQDMLMGGRDVTE